jgi:hypothetical protein
MKVPKNLFPVFIIIFLSSSVFAQKSPEAQAEKMVTKLNNAILKGDPELGLSEEQKETITKLHIERIKTIEAYETTDATEEEVKAKSSVLRKEANKKIAKEVLTKEQVAANKIGKKAAKAEKGTKPKKGKKGKKDTPKKKPAKNTNGQKKAAKSAAKMNDQIKSIDANLALSETQIQEITALYNEKFTEVAKLKDTGAEKAVISTFNKGVMEKILNQLTPEQQKARKKAIKEERAKKKK